MNNNILVSIMDPLFDDECLLLEDMKAMSAEISSEMKFTNGPFRSNDASLFDFYKAGAEKLNTDHPFLAGELLNKPAGR